MKRHLEQRRFFKLVINTLTTTLVDKKIVTEEYLQDRFDTEVICYLLNTIKEKDIEKIAEQDEIIRYDVNMFKDIRAMMDALDMFIYKSESLCHEPLRNDCIKKINDFLEDNKLNTDPHNFVDMSKVSE